ncbi:hypothetical protein F4801DRAFT_579191 [Xylaria longipes]|nr:hypothetical protein F4801DRAFT_579191 [Xylaria longipes]RYC59727.1 hypothetical protein CHU98_g6470 [Xylaria longipes]
MADVAVRESPVDWVIVPPLIAKQGSLFTAVVQFDGRIDLLVYEAYIPNKSGGVSERFLGEYIETGPGFNNNGRPTTYVWFNIWAQKQEGVQIKFRLTWREGRRLYGCQDTFELRVRKDVPPIIYRTDDQDLLALLDPNYYAPTPIEEMNERS